MRWLFVLLFPLTACATHAFTPPARPMPIGPAVTPAIGEGDLQLDGNASGEVLGPGILGGNLRYRHGVAERIAVTADVGFARAADDNSDENPFAGLARAGVQIATRATDELDVAAFAGAGGGYAPAAGGWLSADVGGIVSGDHRYVRPVFVANVYASQPVGSKDFAVGNEMLTLPRTAGVQGLAGFDLGRRDRAVMVGLAVAQLWAAATEYQEATSTTFFGLGGGFRFVAL